MQGKLVLVSSEMPMEMLGQDSYLKQIVSGEDVEAEKKYKDSFSYKPYCRIICATNELPHLKDNTNAFERRAVIVSFDRDFRGEGEDLQLAEKFKKEMSGILVSHIPHIGRRI